MYVFTTIKTTRTHIHIQFGTEAQLGCMTKQSDSKTTMSTNAGHSTSKTVGG